MRLNEVHIVTSREVEDRYLELPKDIEAEMSAKGYGPISTLRLYYREEPETGPVTRYIYDHFDFWLSLLPPVETLRVRTPGWQALLRRGYPLASVPDNPRVIRPVYVSFSRELLIEACREDPMNATLDLEVVADLADIEGKALPAYLGFVADDDFWSPLLGIRDESFDEVVAAIENEYGLDPSHAGDFSGRSS